MRRFTLPSRRVTGAVTVGALVLAAQVLASSVPAAAATTYTVSTTADVAASAGACGNSAVTTAPSPLSLREATCLANNAGGSVAINVPSGTYNLVNGELQLDGTGQNATITGAGSASTIIDAGGNNRVLDLDPYQTGGVATSISGVTITGGADDTFGGAGIIGGNGGLGGPLDSLTLNNVVLTGNRANLASPSTTVSPGGAVQFYGGQLSITNSVISNNSSGSSDGSGVAYQAFAGGETLTISGTTFSGNAVANSSGSTGVTAGGALTVFGTTANNYTVTDSRFVNNTASAVNGSGSPVGAAIYQHSGNLTVTKSSFTGNSVSGGNGSPVGGAVKQDSGSLTLHYNRFAGNIAPSGSAVQVGAGTADAAQNWWGCNAGPGASGCDTVAGPGTVTTTPRLVLSASATPSTVIGPNGSSTLSGSFLTDSFGSAVGSANLSAFGALPMTFSDPPGDATVTLSAGAHTAGTTSGKASIDYHSGTVTGPNPTNISFDNQTVTTSVTVNQAPAITSANSATFTTGQAGSFTVTTTGYPAPAITRTGTLPSGLTFTDNGNGTATLAGTPTGGGTYPLNITANNGVNPNATQTLTVSVGQAPAFTSSNSAVFAIGQAGSFTVTTSGVPTVSTISETGTLPAGVTFTDNGNGTATVAGTPTGTGGTYPVTLTATNGVLPNGTQSLTIQVNQAPAVTGNPADQTVQPGTSVSFSASASGVPTPVVQWQRSTNGGASFSNIAGATSTTYTFTAAAGDNGNQYRAVFTNGSGSATTTAATLNVGSAPAFTSTDHTALRVGTAGSFAVTTSGMPSAMLSRTGAQFPAWLTLTDYGDGTGTLTGTPPAGSGGSYQFTLKATNGFSPSASQTFTLFVDQSPVITSTNHATFTVGQAAAFAVTTTAGFPTSTTLTKTGTLPSGVTFTDNGDGSASLMGTPATGTGGTYPITISASSNGTAPDTTQSFTLTVNEPPRITSTNHATFLVGTAGSFTVTTAAGNPTSTTLSKSGVLPAGMTFTDNGDGTATVSGTPNAGSGGAYTFTITAANGVAPNATQSFTLSVNEGADITSADHATFRKDAAGAFTVTTAGGQPSAITLTKSGALPAGVTFTDNGDGTATIGGTPTTGGSYPITITASNGVLPDRTQAFTLTVNAPAVITSASATTFDAGTAGSFTVTTSDGYPNATTITKTGTLPSGVTFADNGDGTATLAGTPGAHTGGSYPITVTAANGVLPSGTQSFTLTVTEKPEFTSPDSAAFAIGSAGDMTVRATGYPTPNFDVTGALPSGVTFADNGDGTATVAGTPAAGTAGSYSLTIGAESGSHRTTQSFTLTVGKKPQAITVQSAVPASPIVGTSYTLAATADSQLPVTYAVNQTATTNEACSIAAGKVRLEHVGHCQIDYTQDGNGTWAAAATMHDVFDVAAVATTTALSSSKPTTVYGESATLRAHVTAGGSVPAGKVQFAVDGHDLGSPVTLDASGDAESATLADSAGKPLAPGSHAVAAAFVPTDPSVHATSGDTDTQIVDKAVTTTDLAVGSATLTATVAPVAPGAGQASGNVTFFVAGTSVGSASVADGMATLAYAVPAGKAREVAASYAGDTRFLASSDSVSRRDPSITAKISSKVKPTRYGWYRTPVTITFRCTASGAPLTTPCPKPVTLRKNAAGQSVSRTIAAADGGMSTVTVRGIDIDQTSPRVSVTGVRNGATYYGAAPKARCVGKDTLSGIATCRVVLTKSGITTKYRATATDRAGNSRTVTGSYRTSGILLQGTSFTKGAWNVKAGRTYTIVAYAGSRPTYYDAAVFPRTPSRKDGAFRKAGSHRWAIGITMDHAMHAHKYWNLGVRIGGTMHKIKVRVR